jgi:hypothetical protein
MVEVDGIVIANDGALVASYALSFLNEGYGTFSTLGVGTLFPPLPVEGSSYAQGLLLTALSQLVSPGHVTTTCGGSPSNLATHKLTKTSPKQ